MSTFTNSDPLVYGDTFIPQMRAFDAFSLILAALVVLLPTMLGRKFLADDAGHRHYPGRHLCGRRGLLVPHALRSPNVAADQH